MGYYSFYKIFQDIIRKLFNIKIWKICLIIILLFLFCSAFSKCFGADTIYVGVTDFSNNNSIDVALPSVISNNDLNYVIGFSKSAYYYFIYASNDTIYITNNSLFSDGSLKYAMEGSFSSFSQLTSFIPNHIDRVTSYKLSISSYITTPENYYYYSNTDIKDTNNNVIFNDNTIKYPEIANSLSDLETLNFDVVSIDAWDWSNKDFDILFYDRNNVDTSTTEGLYPKRVITLNKETSYYQPSLSADPDKNAIFWIPIEETGLNFYVSGNYEIRLAERKPIQRWRRLS